MKHLAPDLNCLSNELLQILVVQRNQGNFCLVCFIWLFSRPFGRADWRREDEKRLCFAGVSFWVLAVVRRPIKRLKRDFATERYGVALVMKALVRGRRGARNQGQREESHKEVQRPLEHVVGHQP